MKLCKKIAAIILAAAMLVVCSGALAAYEPHDPEIPEGYDGFVTFSVSAITMGWSYIIDPVLVPVHEGETVAAVTARAFEMLDWGYDYSGTVEEGFYLNGVACYETEPDVPAYLMEQILAYPAWAEEQFGYNYGEWTGTYTDDEMLSNYEYCGLSGWMYIEDNIMASDGADAHTIKVGSVYTWIFSIYGWGVDYGISDGWGMFPIFDNPMTGVSRVEAERAIAQLGSDEYILSIALDAAEQELVDFLNVFYDPESTQEQIDEALAILLEALDVEIEYAPGDVNMDGVVDTADVLLVMRAAMEVEQLSDEAAALADYNGDGVINMTDALLILRSVA